MRGTYREVTYRSGKPLAAYYSLPRNENDRSSRVEKRGPGLLVDLTEDGRPIGIEIAIPSLVTLDAVNEILTSYGLGPIDAAELATFRLWTGEVKILHSPLQIAQCGMWEDARP